MSHCNIDLFQETTFANLSAVVLTQAEASVVRAAKNDAAIDFSGTAKLKKQGRNT